MLVKVTWKEIIELLVKEEVVMEVVFGDDGEGVKIVAWKFVKLNVVYDRPYPKG